MKVYVLVQGDVEGTFFADAVFSTEELAKQEVAKHKDLDYVEIELDSPMSAYFDK